MNIINKQLKMSGCENVNGCNDFNVKVTQILLILLLAKVFTKRNFSGNKQLHVEWIPDNMVK